MDYPEEVKELVFQIMDQFSQEIQRTPIGKFTIEFVATHGLINASAFLDETDLFTPEIASALAYNLSVLREKMYDSERGAWFTCIILINPSIEKFGNFQIAFNYDEPPLNLAGTALSVENVIEDMKNHPRSEEYIPEWLKFELSYQSVPALESLDEKNVGGKNESRDLIT